MVSPRSEARIAGALYLVNIVTSLTAFSGGGGSRGLAIASGIMATVSYAAVTVVLYDLFRPVDQRLSLVAALFSLAGCAAGLLSPLHLVPFRIHPLVFFGVYCLLIGYLILRSTFLPGFLGPLMILAGLGWLSFLSRPLAAILVPYVYFTGGIGEGVLTVWLLAAGVNAARWKQQAAKHDSRTAIS